MPDDSSPAAHPELRIGLISFFGVADATDPDQSHGGSGLTRSFDITSIVDDIQITEGITNLSNLKVNLVPRREITSEDNITIDRISIYRQGK